MHKNHLNDCLAPSPWFSSTLPRPAGRRRWHGRASGLVVSSRLRTIFFETTTESMNVSTSTRDTVATIRLQGRFDFSVHREFREAVKSAVSASEVREIEIDLSAVTYMDSSALGMLLLSRENAAMERKTVILVRPAENVRQVLEVANFHKLFTIR